MFHRLRKALSRDGKNAAPSAGGTSAFAPVSQWAPTHGLSFSGQPTGFALDGQVAGKRLRVEVGQPSRKYIQGSELRARAELGIDPDVLAVLINRALKETLERQAYARYTDSLQTSIDASLPEEMRLVAMHEEVGWESMPREFWSRYSLVADDRECAQAWIDPVLARQLLEWPEPAPAPDVPFMLLLLRGKAYLRMQHGPGLDMPTLQHATDIFTAACENAVAAFRVD